MAVVVGHGVVPIKPDFGADFHRNIQREGAKATDGLTKQFGGAFKNIAKLAGGIFIGAQVVSVFKSAFAEAAEAQKIGKLTEQVIKTTGGAAKITAKQIGDLSTAISNKAGIDDEAIQSGANLVATFTKVRNEAGKGNDIFSQTVKVATDMSVALGQDMKSSSLQLGKALNDPIKGVTALTRAGVSFTQQQKDQIKALQESGDLLGAQKLILAEVQTQFGGAAEAAASPVDKLKVVWGNLLEDLGTRALPVIEKVASALADNLPKALDTLGDAFRKVADPVTATFRFFKDFPEVLIPVGAAILGVVVPALVIKATAVWANVTAWWALNSAMIIALAPFIAIGLAVAALVAGVIYAYKHFEVFRKVVDTVARFVQDHLKPILIGIGTVMLGPVVLIVGGLVLMYQKFSWFRTGVALVIEVVKTVITTAVDVIIAVFKAVAATATWLYDNVLLPVFNAITAVIRNVLIPVFNFIKAVVVDFVFPLVMAIIKEAWDIIQPIFNKIWEVITNVVVPAFNLISGVVTTVWDIIRPIFETIISFVQDKLTPVWQGIAWAVSAAFDAIPGLIQGALRLVGGIVAGFLDGVGSIADAIGLDDIAKVLRNGASSARGWGQGSTSNNTGQGQGGIAVQGGVRRAMGGPIPGSGRGDHVRILAEPGEFMVRRREASKPGVRSVLEAINEGRLGFAAGGLIPDLGDIARGAVDKARSLGTAALESRWPKMDAGGGLFTKTGLPAGAANFMRDAIFKLIRGKESEGKFSGSGAVGGAGAAAAAIWIRTAMGLTGTPESWFNTLMARAKLESGFNPRAINLWDSNAKKGTPSKGLFQTIDGTFNRYKLPGHGDIWNPVDNAAAAMQYIKARYGTIFNINPRTGYAEGGLVHLKNFDGGGVLSPGWNAVRNDTGRDEHLSPRGAPLVENFYANNREDVDEFWRRAEFAAMAGRL